MFKELLAQRKKMISPAESETNDDFGSIQGEVSNLRAIGSGAYGRLAQGKDHRDRDVYIPVKSGHSEPYRALQIASGAGHALAVVAHASGTGDDESTLLCSWGKCHFGQLGHGQLDQDRHVLTIVPLATWIAPSLPMKINIRQIAAGDSFSCLLTDQGHVYTWGMGLYGSLGHGDNQNYSRPKLLESLLAHPITLLAPGGFHMLALDELGRVFGWGRNELCQLGLGDKVNRKSPCHVEVITSKLTTLESHPHPTGSSSDHLPSEELADGSNQFIKATILAAGFSHSIIVLEDGRVWKMGAFDEHALIPQPISISITPKSVVCGKRFTLILSQEGELWIDNGGYPLSQQQDIEYSTSTTTTNYSSSPSSSSSSSSSSSIPFSSNWRILLKDAFDELLPKMHQIGGGAYHCHAIDERGRLFTWGCSKFQKLGRTQFYLENPALVESLPSSLSVLSVVGGSNQSFILTS